MIEGSAASSSGSKKDDVVSSNDDVLVGTVDANENTMMVNPATKNNGVLSSQCKQHRFLIQCPQFPLNYPREIADSEEIDPRAFKSQFDEISNASRLLENAKLNNFNNRYNGSIGQATTTNHFPLRRTGGTLSPLPNTPLGFGLYEQDEYLSLKLHQQLSELNSEKVASGEIDDDGLRPKSSRDFNNNELDWDSSSTLPSTPGGPFSSLTPSSSYSTRSNTSYFVPSHALLDDDELLEKQLLLEEEQKLLSFQKQKLDNAINQLRYHSNDSSLMESKFKYTPSPPRPRSTTPTSKKQLPRSSLVPSGPQQTPTPPRFQHNHQEPIGTPLRKTNINGLGTNSPTSVSAPEQRSTFSLFAKSPVLSLNHTFLPKVNEHLSSSMYGNLNSGKASDGLHGGYPLTPASTPPRNIDEECYFFDSHHLNLGTNYHATNSGRSSDSHHHHSAPPTPNYYSHLTPICTQFAAASQFPLTPNSVTGYSARAPLYSSPVDERDEDALSWDDKSFVSTTGSKALPTKNETDWNNYHTKIENKLHQKFCDVPSSMMTSSNGNGFTSRLMETVAFGNHGRGFELEV
ncbi:13206_t:CDS:2, partial [Acaulospora colombiana]